MQSLLMDIGFAQPLLQAFCRMLVHSLWLGLLLTLAAGLVVVCTRRSTAALRYNLLTILLFIFLAACGFIFLHACMQASIDTPVSGYVPVVTATAWQSTVMQFCTGHANAITTVWLVFFVFKCWQMTMAFRYVKKIRTSGRSHTGDAWNEKIQALARQLQVKQTVRLLESAVTKVPVVIGHLKPVIYMPVGLLTNLPADQVEAVLLHELAHIRRRDYLANLLQHIAESIFFFNPGLLWLCSLLRREREHCCDDMALQLVARKKPFLEALVSFREYTANESAYTMAFPGTSSHLLQRVTRIVNNRNTALTKAEKIFFTASVAVLLLFPRFRSHHIAATTLSQEPLATAGLVVKDTTTITAPVQTVSKSVTAADNTTRKRADRRVRKRTVQATLVQTNLESVQRIEPSVAIQDKILLEKARRQDEQLRQLAALDEHRRGEMKRMADLRTAKIERDRERERIRHERQLFDEDRRRANQDRMRIDMEKRQAERQRRDAERDKERTERDRERAEKERERADHDRQQAEENRRNAEQMRRENAAVHTFTEAHQLRTHLVQQNAGQYRWQVTTNRKRSETNNSNSSNGNSSSDSR